MAPDLCVDYPWLCWRHVPRSWRAPVRAQSPSGQIITNTASLAPGEIIRVQGGEIRHLSAFARWQPGRRGDGRRFVAV